MKRLLAMAVLALSCTSVFAQEGAVFIGTRFGLGHIDIGTERDRTFGFNLSLGYRASSGFLTEVGASFQTSDDIFGSGDSLDLAREEFMVGYQIRLGDTLSLIPKIGRVHWELKNRDGALIDFSNEDASRVLGEGSEDIAELVFEFRLSDLLQLGISHEKLRYRSAESDMSEVGLRFEF